MSVAVAGRRTQQQHGVDHPDGKKRDDVTALKVFRHAAEIPHDDERDQAQAQHADDLLHDQKPRHGATVAASLEQVATTPLAYPFAHRQRVRFGETDLQGVVYYANYLLFAEVGRIAYLRALGIDYKRDLIEQGADFTIGEASVRYQAPLRFDDEYDIRVRVGEIRKSSWTFEYAFDRADGQRCAIGSTVQVILDRATSKVARIPQHLRDVLERAKAA